MDRRHFLRSSALGSAALASTSPLSASTTNRVGVTDWTIGGMAQLKALDLAAEIGLQGVQVSITPEPTEDQYDLRQADDQKALQEKSAATGIAIASTAMGIFNKRPFKEVPEAVEWATQGVEATADLGKNVMLMAFFGKNDLKHDTEGTAETIKRLKAVAPIAEDKGVILGLETTLSADEHLHIINAVNSPAVQVYYDLGNSHRNGYDINTEIRQLGRELICEVHCKDSGTGLFGVGEVNFPTAGEALSEIGYDSWYILEGKAGKGLTMLDTLAKNDALLRKSGFAD